ncbi:S41 family peptidase [Massilia aerilata]|uniref:S41 family peptidase n=1 Tax=Massilia aerilata TaxID=453817 RepID=A0ABW0RVT9_9BURK
MKKRWLVLPCMVLLASVAVFRPRPDVAIDKLVAGLDEYQRQKDGAYDGAGSGMQLAHHTGRSAGSAARGPQCRLALAGPDRAQHGTVRRRQGRASKAEDRLPEDLRFPEPSLTAEHYAEAMNRLADTDALIVDLRTRLNDIWYRASGESAQFWTLDKLEGQAYGGRKPVLILAGPRTASAGEDFTYTMQALKRPTVIGERTWGGDHLYAAIPAYRSISPITHANWEGKGMTPDVAAAPATALGVAKALLRRRPGAAG